MTEYVESIAIMLQVTAIVGNIVLAYLLFFCVSNKDIILEKSEDETDRGHLGTRAARWIISTRSRGILFLVSWMLAFLSVPLFVPETYQAEMLEVILANISSIPIPIMPGIAASRACLIHLIREESRQRLDRHAESEPA